MSPLRVMTYNVRYFGHALRGLASTRASKLRIAQRLATLDPRPDVICLQEVETISVRSSLVYRRSHPAQTQLESFMEVLHQACEEAGNPCRWEAFYFPAHVYGPGSAPIYTTGLAILVDIHRLRVAGHNAHAPHHITHHHVVRLREAKQSRICAHVRLQDEHDRALHVFNTHLSLPTPFAAGFWKLKDKLGHGANQLAEARTLAAYIDRHAGGEPLVLCGDFNSPPGSPVFRYLTEEAGLKSAQLALNQVDLSNPRHFPTAGFMRLRMHLDHLMSRGVDWLDLDGTRRFGDAANFFRGLSDHVPLIGRFSIG